MDSENTLGLLFPQADARLIKAIVLDGDEINSALDFLIKEGMQPDGLKSDKTYGLVSNNIHVNGTFVMHTPKRHLLLRDLNEPYSIDSCHEKHEEAIVWNGGSLCQKLEDYCPNEGQGLDDFYESDYQQEGCMQGNERIDWWAATWPNAAGLREDVLLDSSSSVETDSEVQEEASSPLWSDTELYKSFSQKINWQRPIMNTHFSSMQSYLVEKEKSSFRGNVSGLMTFHEGCKSLRELDLPLSQDSFEVFPPIALDANMSEQGRPASNPSTSYTELSKEHATVDDSKFSSSLSVNVWRDCAMQEGLLESSRYLVDTEKFDRLVLEAKSRKAKLRKGMDNIHLLRQKVEQEELAAQQAKAKATRGGADILLKVEDLRQQTLHEKAEYDTRAAEVYGERSVLSMEARELRSRLLETQAEQARATTLLDSVHCTLTDRLQKASQEKCYAEEEAKFKEESAKELLAQEEDSARTFVEYFKALETEAETCRKLREFLIERGNIVDSLQGEMAVLCEDILSFKKQVDEGIPLSASRSWSWSHMSHLTEQTVSTTPLRVVKNSGSSLFLNLDSSVPNKSSRDTSILALSSGTSGLPTSVGSIDCTLQSQYFSLNTRPIETSEVADRKRVVDGLDEKVGGLTIACISCDDVETQQSKPENLCMGSGCV